MRKHTILGVTAFTILIILPQIMYAASFKSKTVPFGSRVLSTTIPTVTCETINGGTAPVLLTSNLVSVAHAVYTGVSSSGQNQPIQKTFTMGKDIYRAIPLYTQQSTGTTSKTQPKPGVWILGRQKLIPDFATCVTDIFGAPIPFPVVPTNNYGVSKSAKF